MPTRYLGVWGQGFAKPGLRVMESKDIDEINGYSPQQIEQIHRLRPGVDVFVSETHGARHMIFSLGETRPPLKTGHPGKCLPPPPKYDIDVARYVAPGKSTVSDVRLALELGHGRKGGMTVLLSTTVGTRTYTLVVCGGISGHDDRLHAPIDSGVFTAEQIERLEKGDGDITLDSAPWLEWIDSSGNAVGDVFESIDLDPAVEISKLRRDLHRALADTLQEATPSFWLVAENHQINKAREALLEAAAILREHP